MAPGRSKKEDRGITLVDKAKTALDTVLRISPVMIILFNSSGEIMLLMVKWSVDGDDDEAVREGRTSRVVRVDISSGVVVLYQIV
jgi:hypothetical protein